MLNFIEAKPKTENEKYLESVEWKELLEKAEKAVNQSYTIIYRDQTGDLNEAWHYLSDMNIKYVKEKYAKQKKEILIFEPMTIDFGRRLASMSGSSRADR